MKDDTEITNDYNHKLHSFGRVSGADAIEDAVTPHNTITTANTTIETAVREMQEVQQEV